jgi:diguanylate cyclase (GGDEF)-like protein
LQRAALHDPLTDLPNRRLLYDRLEHALAGAERTGAAVAVLFIDIDGFKRVNDVHGHEIGDQLLLQIAQRFQACIRGTDTLARLGGDEFVVVLEHVTDAEEPHSTAQRLSATLGSAFQFGPVSVEISASIGIALSTTGAQRSLLHAADSAMYIAKTAGPGRIVTSQSDPTTRTPHPAPEASTPPAPTRRAGDLATTKMASTT